MVDDPPKIAGRYTSNKYHLTPEETLSIAQELYEKLKCLSYPRTPSTVLGDDNVELFRTKFELLSAHYPQLAQRCANKYISSDNKRLFNSAKLQDHHALIPLAVLPADATEKQKNVYEAVLLRFFQTVMEPHIYEITTVKAALPESSDEEFIAKGKAIVQPGWKTTDSETDPEEEIQALPAGLKKADKLPVIESNILEKETVDDPPKIAGRYTEKMHESLRIVQIESDGTYNVSSDLVIDSSRKVQVVFQTERFTALKVYLNRAITFDDMQKYYLQVYAPYTSRDPATQIANAQVTFVQDSLGNYMVSKDARALSDFAVGVVNPVYAYDNRQQSEDSSSYTLNMYSDSSYAVHDWNTG